MPDEIDFKDLPLEKLIEAQEKLTRYLQIGMENKKKEALQQIQGIVKQHGLSYQEVVAAVRTVSKRGRAVAPSVRTVVASTTFKSIP